MSLTQNQLQSLRADLQGLANIEYDEVMAELLDHYATLTEQKMANGLPFSEATNRAWAELGSGIGLEQIQTDYEKNVRQQVKMRHIEILKSYFGWPTFIMTALSAALIYVTAPFVPVKGMLALLCTFGMAPMLFLFYGFRKHMDKQTDNRKIIWTYLHKSGSIIWNVFYVAGLNGLNSFTDAKSAVWLFQIHSTVGIILCWLALLYSVSFIQLFREQFIYKPKIA